MTITIKPQKVTVSANPEKLTTSTGIPVARAYIGAEPYEGEYVITPSTEAQIIPINGMRAIDNFTINPIPSNYGRIDWNGQYLTVS